MLVGPGLIAASALAAWTPAVAGAAGFTAAVEFAGIPVAVVLGFFIHARGDLAAEFMRQSAQAHKWRAWEYILALRGGTAIWALFLLVAYIAAAKGSEEGASGTAARCLAPLAAATAAVLLVLFLVAGWVRDAQAVEVWYPRRGEARPLGSRCRGRGEGIGKAIPRGQHREPQR